ncbi:MAG: inositol monophosphatase, partial [Bacteroidaceae bacterium]|nr:inositol monophosphatase [Bacteroidaceae bacterium]
MEQLDDILRRATEWARECGALQLTYFRSPALQARAKGGESDIVTEVDEKSEAMLLRHIAEEYPTHSVLGEETGDHPGTAEWRWVIDPLDGTTNYKAGLPIFAVSIALEHHGEAVLGVVFAPYLDEMFTAVKGKGAFLNGKPIHCSATTDLARAVVCTGFPVDKGSTPDNNLDNFSRVMPLVRGMRRLGSAALDICYVGAGIL